MLLKIGELAKRTGLTIRALRHYDEIGLLIPSVRSESSYRLYNREDVAKLYRIQALRRLDISLAEIQKILSSGAATLPEVIVQQIFSLERQIQQATTLRNHLVELQSQLEARHEPEIDDWLAALENMVAGTKYFTDAELRALKAQRRTLTTTEGSEKAELIATLHRLIEQGVPPDSTEARTVAHRWIEWLLEEVGGDEGMLIKLYTMHWNEPALHSLTGIDQNRMNYISHAMAHHRLGIYAKYCLPEEIKHLRKHYVTQTTAWPPLIAAVRHCMAQGLQPNSKEMRPLAHQWLALSRAKVGGNSDLQVKLQTILKKEPSLRFGSGIDEPLLVFINDAIRALHTASIDHKQKAENQ